MKRQYSVPYRIQLGLMDKSRGRFSKLQSIITSLKMVSSAKFYSDSWFEDVLGEFCKVSVYDYWLEDVLVISATLYSMTTCLKMFCGSSARFQSMTTCLKVFWGSSARFQFMTTGLKVFWGSWFEGVLVGVLQGFSL